MPFPDPDLKTFENLPFHVVAISPSYEVVYSNRGTVTAGAVCYKALWGLDQPCSDCRLSELFAEGETFKKSGQSDVEGQTLFISCEYRLLHGHAVCFIDDKTQMISALKRVKEELVRTKQSFSGQEEKLNAQNRMLRHKLNTVKREQDVYPKIFEGVAPGLLRIDKNKEILNRNHRFGEILKNIWGPEQRDLSTCHELLFGRKEPCSDCPIGRKSLKQHKVTHRHKGDSGEGYITEEITMIENEYVITVTNSTRTIELAMDIQEYIAEIHAINTILNSVMACGVELQNTDSLETIFERALTELAEKIFENTELPMVMFQKHAPGRNLEQLVMRSVDGPTRKMLVDSLACKDMDYFRQNGWHVLPMSGSERKGTGFFMYGASELEEKRRNILKIFINMVGSLAENFKLMADLERQASIDGLTGTYNRAYFEKRFGEEKEKAEKIGMPFGILVLDINGLKKVNDEYGHLAGDTLIKASGALLKEIIREHDVLSRFGGDEYVILLPATGSVGTNVLLNRINQSQEDATYCFDNENGDTITKALHMSVGAASSEEVAVEKVFNLADERMYQAKERFYETHERYR